MVAQGVLSEEIEQPSDWPADGPIDLSVHDRPHASSTTEWWYVNGHCETDTGQRFSLFVSFFRKVSGRDPETREFDHVHSVTWALQEVDAKKTHGVSRVDSRAAAEGLKRIKRGLGAPDERLNMAMSELLETGEIPKPDRYFDGRVFVSPDNLDLAYGRDSLRRLDDGRYALRLHEPEAGFGCDVVLEPKKGAHRHGDNGVVRGTDDEKMFYYFIPRCELTGRIELHGSKQSITSGSAWYDHEFGVGEVEVVDDEAEAKLGKDELKAVHDERRKNFLHRQVGWDWLSVQFEDGSDLSVYPCEYVYRDGDAGNWSVLSGPDGTAKTLTDASIEHLETWRSYRTFSTYPVKWNVKIPSARVDLQVEAAFDDQEFITLISKPSFWEGRVNVTGTVGGRPVSGLGFIERSGFAAYEDLDGFFEQVGQIVRKSVRDVIPLKPTFRQAADLIATKDDDSYMQGVDIDQYARTHLAPIREIVDRGGKGWRSYAAITCCDIVGGDSRDFVQWLAMPEMMHVGSLIVDDVQDKSDTRRGKPTAHMMYGEAQAINSGTAAYFMIWPLLRSEKVSDRDKLRIYDEYFYGMRAGHAGQALDLDGFEELTKIVVESGDSSLLVERVLGVHRLKTGAPAGCLARMGAIGGSGTDVQVKALGRFFEDLGLAFQIVDDVLNIRGFKGDLKSRAEDVRQGKITLPVAHALGRLNKADRQWLREGLLEKPQDDAKVNAIVEMLESCGAVDECATTAYDLVENGWKQLEPVVENTMAKVMLRAFGWYLLQRHY